MVTEGEILLRIENLQKCRRRISSKICTDLVHFIHHEYRIIPPTSPQSLDDPSRHGSHVCSPVPPYLSFVPDATERDSDKFPSQCPCYGPAQRRLPHSRRTNKTQDRTLYRLRELPHTQVLEDPLFDLIQAVVILIQDRLGALEIQIVFSRFVPRESKHPVQIVPDDCRLRGFRMHLGKTTDLFLELFPDFLRNLQLF